VRSLLFVFTFLFVLDAKAQEAKSLDSLKERGANVKGKGDSISNKIDSVKSALLKKSKLAPPELNLPDSLNPIKKSDKNAKAVNSKLKSMTSVDSLFLFNPEMRKVDSLKLAYQTKSREIQNKANRKQKQIKRSLDSLQLKCKTQSDALTKKFMSKNKDILAGHEKEIADKANFNMPAVSSRFPDLSLNTGSINQPGLSLPDVQIPNAQLPNLALPSTNLPNESLPNTSVPNASLPNVSLPNINVPNIDTKEIQKESTELKQLGGQAGDYKKQLEQIKKDSAANAQKLEKMIEDQAQGRREIKALKDKQLEAEKLKKLQQEYVKKVEEYKNPKQAEAEIKQNLANVANADMVKNEKYVQSGQQELAKAKKKYGEFQSIKNLPKRPPNPLKGVPLRERIYPGILFQNNNNKFFCLDLAPQVYYKITTRFDAGMGLIYRFNYDFKKSSTVPGNDLYGYKMFADFRFYKSFYFRAEGERVFKQQPTATNPDITFSRWTNTLLGGIGKEFLISRKIQGNSLVLYNVLEKYDNPYSSKVLIRIGFNLSLKKSQRKEFLRSLKGKPVDKE
jgi:hypothetical protein